MKVALAKPAVVGANATVESALLWAARKFAMLSSVANATAELLAALATMLVRAVEEVDMTVLHVPRVCAMPSSAENAIADHPAVSHTKAGPVVLAVMTAPEDIPTVVPEVEVAFATRSSAGSVIVARLVASPTTPPEELVALANPRRNHRVVLSNAVNALVAITAATSMRKKERGLVGVVEDPRSLYTLFFFYVLFSSSCLGMTAMRRGRFLAFGVFFFLQLFFFIPHSSTLFYHQLILEFERQTAFFFLVHTLQQQQTAIIRLIMQFSCRLPTSARPDSLYL